MSHWCCAVCGEPIEPDIVDGYQSWLVMMEDEPDPDGVASLRFVCFEHWDGVATLEVA